MWVSWAGLQCVIVAVPGHTHLYFGTLVFFRAMSIPINMTEKTGRGRAYKCLQCGYMEEKRRVISHWYKTHLHYTESPFYCTVCLFRATKEKDLIDHIKPGVYPPHQRGVDLKQQMNIPVDINNMLIRNHAAKYPVEGVDYICMTQEESVSIWGQRKRSSSIGSQSIQQEASTDNILPTLLDYYPNERITPVPVATPVLPVTPITVPGYSPQLQRPVYNPTPLHQIAPVRSSQSDLLQTALQTTQIASSDRSFRPLSESPYSGWQRTTSTVPILTASSSSDSTPPNNDIAAISRLLPDSLLDNTAATSILHPTSTSTSVTHIPPVTTLPPTCTNTPVSATSTAQATVQTSTTDASINTETQDSPVAKAILEMSKNLVEAIERQTFQIEMTKNTLSAFLRRLDDRDRERKSPANREIDHSNGRRTLVIPKRRRSETPVKSPATKKKKISGYCVVPENKKK